QQGKCLEWLASTLLQRTGSGQFLFRRLSLFRPIGQRVLSGLELPHQQRREGIQLSLVLVAVVNPGELRGSHFAELLFNPLPNDGILSGRRNVRDSHASAQVQRSPEESFAGIARRTGRGKEPRQG